MLLIKIKKDLIYILYGIWHLVISNTVYNFQITKNSSPYVQGNCMTSHLLLLTLSVLYLMELNRIFKSLTTVTLLNAFRANDGDVATAHRHLSLLEVYFRLAVDILTVCFLHASLVFPQKANMFHFLVMENCPSPQSSGSV